MKTIEGIKEYCKEQIAIQDEELPTLLEKVKGIYVYTDNDDLIHSIAFKCAFIELLEWMNESTT